MNVLINITYHGQSGNYLVNLDPGLDDRTIKNICEEAVRAGNVPGIDPGIPRNAFANFVIDRFNTEPVRFVVRPKVPFGRACNADTSVRRGELVSQRADKSVRVTI